MARIQWRRKYRQGLVLSVLLLGALACAPPDRAQQGNAPRLYVADAAGSRIVVLDSAGRRTGELRLGAAPGQVALGWRGGLAVLPALPLAAGEAQAVLHASPQGRTALWGQDGAWRVAFTPLEEIARDTLLAADGGRHAAVVHHVARETEGSTVAVWGERIGSTAPCRLILVDQEAQRAVWRAPVCGAGERGVGLALEETASGAVTYLAIEAAGAAGTGGRIVALDAAGRPLASRALAGAPGKLVLGPAMAGVGRRLYAVETLRRPEATEPAQPYEGRLLSLIPETLDAEAAYSLPLASGSLAVDGAGTAYVLAGDVLLRLGTPGSDSPPAMRLPGKGVALALGDEWVYVAAAYESRLWLVDRRTLRIVRSVELPGHPSALVMGW